MREIEKTTSTSLAYLIFICISPNWHHGLLREDTEAIIKQSWIISQAISFYHRMRKLGKGVEGKPGEPWQAQVYLSVRNSGRSALNAIWLTYICENVGNSHDKTNKSTLNKVNKVYLKYFWIIQHFKPPCDNLISQFLIMSTLAFLHMQLILNHILLLWTLQAKQSKATWIAILQIFRLLKAMGKDHPALKKV